MATTTVDSSKIPLRRTNSGSSYCDALSRFDQQTEELKKLLDDEEVVSITSDDDTDDDEEDHSEEAEDSDDDDEEDSDDDDSDEDDSSEYDSSDDDESDWDSDYDDLEAEFTGGGASSSNLMANVGTGAGAGAAGDAPPKKVNSSPALMAMDVSMENEQENLLPGFMNLKDRMRRSSGSYLQSPEYLRRTKTPETIENPYATTRPDDHLQIILEGFSAARFPSETWHNYFLKMTDEHIEAHTTEVEHAIRSEDFGRLRSMIRSGKTLQTCNKHGESIIHIACRRGSLQLLEFLIDEAKVSTRIRDDMGRTALHDACWTHTPNFDLILLLLEASPELLFIVDHRGFTPLTYIPREAWGLWCEWLNDNRHFLRDMVKTLRWDRARYFIKTMVPCLKF